MKYPRFEFAAAVAEELQRLGGRQGGSYGWQIETCAGLLEICPFEDWIACRFDDVDLAKSTVSSGYLNRYSGKWNWNFDKPGTQDVEYFVKQLEPLLA
jgi:hypothetical protein